MCLGKRAASSPSGEPGRAGPGQVPGGRGAGGARSVSASGSGRAAACGAPGCSVSAARTARCGTAPARSLRGPRAARGASSEAAEEEPERGVPALQGRLGEPGWSTAPAGGFLGAGTAERSARGAAHRGLPDAAPRSARRARPGAAEGAARAAASAAVSSGCAARSALGTGVGGAGSWRRGREARTRREPSRCRRARAHARAPSASRTAAVPRESGRRRRGAGGMAPRREPRGVKPGSALGTGPRSAAALVRDRGAPRGSARPPPGGAAWGPGAGGGESPCRRCRFKRREVRPREAAATSGCALPPREGGGSPCFHS